MSENFYQSTIPCMGGEFEIKAYFEKPILKKDIEYILKKISTELTRIEDLLTDFRPSLFNQINEYAGIKPSEVSDEIINLIFKAQEFSKQSDGLFDISYATVGRYWRAARKNGLLPDLKKIESLKKFINYQKIEIDQKNKTVFLPYPQMRIGLGGIGKGYAVDRVCQVLNENGIFNFFVNGSGDIRVQSTKKAPRPWRIGIRNPFSENKNQSIGFIHLANGAIASSGDYINCLKINDTKYHHIIHPHTGKPAVGLACATVQSSDTITADVYATIAMLKSPTEAIQFLNQRAHLGVLVDVNGVVYHSDKSFSALNQYKNHIQTLEQQL